MPSKPTVKPSPIEQRRLDAALAMPFGFLLGLPIAYPAPPMYVLAFLTFILAALWYRNALTIADMLPEAGVVLLIALAIFSNLMAQPYQNIDAARIFTTSFYFLLFLFSRCVPDRRALLLGFCNAMVIWALLIIVLAATNGVHEHGLLLFVVPEFRLWGSPIFPDWPNYLAFMLALAFLLKAIVFRHGIQAFVLLFAAMLTTSRTPVLAVLLLTLCTVWMNFLRPRAERVLLTAGAIALALASLFLLAAKAGINEEFLARMLLFSDRDQIFDFAFDLFQQAPWFGHGSILLDSSVGFEGHASFHNSYLDILVRHGVFALLVFLLLLRPPPGSFRTGGLYFAVTVAFFLVGSIFQNFLKHPHILMLYVVIIHSSEYFRASHQPD